METPTTKSDAARREEERLDQWLGHPERRESMDVADHLFSAVHSGSGAAVEAPRIGVLASLYKAFYSAVMRR